MPIALLSSLIRPLVEPHLPDAVDARFFSSLDELYTMAPEAEIGWFDLNEKEPMAEAVTLASNLKWLNSIYAGLDFLPLDLLRQRGVTITNGVGINAIAIAEYVTMMMLVHAKGYREVVRAQDRREWLPDSPGKIELPGTRALLLGFGAIGQQIKPRLEGLGVEVVPVRRSGADGALGPDEWRGRLGEFDWVILAVPATSETDGMIGAGELAAMKDSAVLVNIARGAVVEQDALVAALEAKSIGGALLDVTTPEPLPADHKLWGLENAHVTMHLSGRAQASMFRRSAERFLVNLDAYLKGEAMHPLFDPARGY
ncbi:MAG: D-2-hydroxyacid dehydrogenase [Sphingomonadaceae bacterium]|jgi:phosphoglycerate dehydrogenase-like enzyme|nr:D-2-hydroxyacid dehydrogenase [Sphingomonadaceae bacterium]MCB2085061.1 D-2-hydroxyacid dehydrogenase [Sphingomonadaceae bacterium]MCP5383499.1 D-2-hydroxyacid dehydrogenase [Altererythrobacter sp.]MCP5392192.1 D-2-hydroxyacid dehydrogenase [Sphingomonadaceae bacterium]MCP5394441.1 D-2-hydroxyacid dehydrogenase [Sphingomonadaceae bacterium]